ncbi:MAG TPA: M56 family metallopeptidase, partial [Saprospiraceae bacterium]|nr:M56 family metallopeptidase [Saprospiraceae bacterium]
LMMPELEQGGLLPAVQVGWQSVSAPARQWPVGWAWWMVYGLGAAAAGVRLAWGVARLAKMAQRGEKYRMDGVRVIRTTEAASPFSFLGWVFVPVADGPPDPLMLAHERAHVRGAHSADVLLMEVLGVLLWFHPLVYVYRRELRTVHEYLADAAASRCTNKKQYGLLLIRQSQPGLALAFVNHSFQSPLKQRLMMLMKQHSAPVRALKYVLVLPLLAFFVLLFQQVPALAQTSPETPTELPDLDVMPSFPGGEQAMMKYLASSIKYPAAARKAKAQGTVLLSLVIEKDGSVSNVQSIKEGLHQDLVDEAIQVVKSMPKWTPGSKAGQVVRVKYTLPIKYKLE